MNLTKTLQRIVCAMLIMVLAATLIPMPASASTVVDGAIIFSDLHTSKSNYKESNLKNVITAMKKSGVNFTSVTSAGDAFSVNEDSSSSNGPYTGYTSTLTNAIHSVLPSVDVNYVWSDHDRYAVQEDGTTLLDKTSRLVYGAGNDGIYGTADDDNYYVYALSMGDLCSYDRYKAGFNYTAKDNKRASKGFTSTPDAAIASFQSAAAGLKKDRPLFIVSHQPLFDNRNDNAFAEAWFDAINTVAEGMDVAFFYGHNHKYDTGSDYYYAKGSSMPVATADGWSYKYETGVGYKPSINLTSRNKTLNFTHMCAGYLEPTSTGSYSSTTRKGTALAITIYEDSINYTTYNDKGIYTGSYAVNVTVKRDHAAPAHTHTFETATVDATCTEAGSITSVCSGCGEETVETVAALSHNYTCKETEATCTAEGSKVFTCDRCGDTYTEVIPATETHKNTTVTVKATCTEAGSVTTTCAVCGKTATEVIAAAGHNYASVVTAPTCNAAGYTTYTCKVCGDGYTGNHTDALGHSYGLVVTATCTENGYEVYTCATCGHSYNGNAVAAYGHNYNTTVVAPTCTTAGHTTSVCATCGHTYTGNETPALGHNYTTVTVKATCTEAGYTSHTCTACGHSDITGEVPALGHNHTASVTAPTCTSAGYTTYTCSTCGATSKGDNVAALGHNYSCKETNGSRVYTCSNCGDTYTEKLAFTYSKVSTLANDNRYVITITDGKKTYALSHKNNAVSATEVTVSNNKITSEITEDLIWNYDNKTLSYDDNGKTYFVNAAASGKKDGKLVLNTSGSAAVSFSSSKLKIGTYYLRYEAKKVVLKDKAGTVNCYIEQ